jgi:hypothetical protein
MIKKIIWLFLIVLSALIVSCSDDNSTGPEEEQKMKQPSVREIEVPDELANKDDPYAKMAVGYMSLVNGFKSFSNMFIPPENESLNKSNEEVVYSWQEGGLLITMYYNEDSNISWEIVFNGTDGLYTFADWVYIDCVQSLDDSWGVFNVYKKVTEEIDVMWEWSTDENGIYHVQYLFNDETDKVNVFDNGDLSGEIFHYELHEGVYKLIEEIHHHTDMSGEYWVYDLEGNIKIHGTWD